MTEPVSDGGPAFPQSSEVGALDRAKRAAFFAEGMSLRDYFAAQALQGIIASYAVPELPLPGANTAASEAYAYADAMLKAREGR